jgi:hypothetical protein
VFHIASSYDDEPCFFQTKNSNVSTLFYYLVINYFQLQLEPKKMKINIARFDKENIEYIKYSKLVSIFLSLILFLNSRVNEISKYARNNMFLCISII